MQHNRWHQTELFPQASIQVTPLIDNICIRYITIYVNERGRLFIILNSVCFT